MLLLLPVSLCTLCLLLGKTSLQLFWSSSVSQKLIWKKSCFSIYSKLGRDLFHQRSKLLNKSAESFLIKDFISGIDQWEVQIVESLTNLKSWKHNKKDWKFYPFSQILISNHLNLKVSTIDNLQLSTKPTKSSDLRSTMLKLIKLNFFVNFLPGRCPMSKDNHHEKCNERICWNNCFDRQLAWNNLKGGFKKH